MVTLPLDISENLPLCSVPISSTLLFQSSSCAASRDLGRHSHGRWNETGVAKRSCLPHVEASVDRFRQLVFAACLSLLFMMCFTSSAEAQLIRVQCPEQVFVTSRLVLLGDVATITCSNSGMKLRASQLDIAELGEKETSCEITASLIRIRLILNGWGTDEVETTGAERIRVQFREPRRLSDADVEAAALKCLSENCEIPQDQLQVRLSEKFTAGLAASIRELDGLRAEVLPPAVVPLGRISLPVRIFLNNDLVTERTARFEVVRRHRVAVTRVSLNRDQIITEDTVQFEDRFLSKPADQPTEEMVFGRQLKTGVQAGSILTVRNLKEPEESPRPILIRRRDNVRVVATSGRIQVTLQNAEAMQDGREGDLIRLKNVQTNQLISGKVTSAGYVIVNLR